MSIPGAGRRRWCAVLPIILALSGLSPALSSSVAAAAPDANSSRRSSPVTGDLNGDFDPDVVVGAPTYPYGTGGGELHVFLSDGGRQRLSLDTISPPDVEQRNARFGASVSTPGIDDDLYGDLAVGAPGVDGAGAVYLLHGSGLGITPDGRVKVTAPDGAAGDEFGAAVVTAVRADELTDLWVGAPGRTVAGHAQAGTVYHYSVDKNFVPRLVGTLSYATAGVRGSPAAGDRFGEVLSTSFGHVVAGVPNRAVTGLAAAGEVVVAAQPSSAVTAQVFNQSSTGVPGSAEAGDRFGAALSWGAVGVPGEDVGALRDAGAVQLFTENETSLVPGQQYTQDSRGIPGVAEAGDRFGAALALGINFLCQEQRDLAVGAPGESLGTLAGAGSVTVIPVRYEGLDPDDAAPCAAKLYRQGRNLPGTAAAGNQVGATLATLSGNADDDEDYRSGLVIGVPGSDLGGKDAGAALTGLTKARLSTVRAIGGDLEGLAFGSVLATPFG